MEKHDYTQQDKIDDEELEQVTGGDFGSTYLKPIESSESISHEKTLMK